MYQKIKDMDWPERRKYLAATTMEQRIAWGVLVELKTRVGFLAWWTERLSPSVQEEIFGQIERAAKDYSDPALWPTDTPDLPIR